jgi:putative ABC transport system permease protein
LLNHKAYSFINIAGVASSMACCLLILLFIQHEIGYDRFPEKADRIYRLVVQFKMGGKIKAIRSARSSSRSRWWSPKNGAEIFWRR